MDCGSRTIDNGMRFTLEVSESGFHLRKDYGVWAVSDLFGEMDWWPTNRAWQGHNEKLIALLDDLAPTIGIDTSKLLDKVRENFEGHKGANIGAYISEEQSQSFSMVGLRAIHAHLVGTFRIPGLPSHDFKEGSSYRGLELTYGIEGWYAILWEPNINDELFLPECWDGVTLAEVINESEQNGTFPWTREGLVGLLADSDPRWAQFIHADFSMAESSMAKSPTVYIRRESDRDWETNESVVVYKASGEIVEDTLVIGRRPLAQDDSEYYLYLNSDPVMTLTSRSEGYGGKLIHEMKQKLDHELAKEGMSLGKQQ